MNLQTALEKEQQQAQQQTIAAIEASELYKFFHLRPTLNLVANERLLREYIAPLPITVANLEIAAAKLGDSLGKIPLQVGQDRIREADQAAKIAAESETEMARSNAVLAAADQKKRWRSLSKEDLRAEIKQMKAVDEISLPAVDVPYSRKQLVSMDTAEMKRLLYTSNGEQRPGVEAEVNRILAGR